MKTENIKEILSWVKKTDLTELRFKEKGSGFAFSTSETPDLSWAELPPSRYQCVSAPAIGIFQSSTPGRAQKVEEGSAVASGETIGFIETIPGKTTPVTAPVSGRVARLLVEASGPVSYGQPILFIEPDGK